MRRTLAVLSVAALAAVVAGPTLSASAAGKSVTVGDNYFVKKSGTPTVTVTKGTTVTWRFTGKLPHTVKVKSGPAKFTSSAKRSGSFAKKVSKAGTYRIICTIHGAGDQSMKLVVR